MLVYDTAIAAIVDRSFVSHGLRWTLVGPGYTFDAAHVGVGDLADVLGSSPPFDGAWTDFGGAVEFVTPATQVLGVTGEVAGAVLVRATGALLAFVDVTEDSRRTPVPFPIRADADAIAYTLQVDHHHALGDTTEIGRMVPFFGLLLV
jgi:hypothetical protein